MFVLQKLRKLNAIFLIAFIFGLCLLCMPHVFAAVSDKVAFAENNPIADSLCNVMSLINGVVGRTIIVFIVIITGLGFFLGKVSFGILLGVGMGMIVVMTSETILGQVVGDKGKGGCACKYNVSGQYCKKIATA